MRYIDTIGKQTWVIWIFKKRMSGPRWPRKIFDCRQPQNWRKLRQKKSWS